MKVAKLPLHDGRSVVVNMDQIIHAMIAQDDENGQEFTRITQESGQVLDVVQTLEDVEQLAVGPTSPVAKKKK